MTLSASSNSFSQTIGEVTTQEAWSALEVQQNATLVDVRTAGEWQETGIADLSSLNKKPITLSWRTQPGMALNPQFEAQLLAAIPDRATPIYFVCRSGGRSADAARAMAQLGYTHCFNVLGGFTNWLAAELPRSNA